MDHLDLEDAYSTQWLPLEPIMEETSDDDELWSHYEHAWSSESETGSVIRVELNTGNSFFFFKY